MSYLCIPIENHMKNNRTVSEVNDEVNDMIKEAEELLNQLLIESN